MSHDSTGKITTGFRTPSQLLVGAIIYALLTGAFVLLLAMQQPWLGLQLSYDQDLQAAVVHGASGPAKSIPEGTGLTEVAAGGLGMRLEAGDFIVETDGVLQTYDIYEDFLKRQSDLAGLQASPQLVFTDTAGREWPVTPARSRPITSLPVEFWVQVAVGIIAWLISAGVWVFRRGELSARFLLLSGWSTAVFAPLAAVYSTRELALPGELFRWLTDLNFMGGSLFAGALVALLTCYPRRIGPRWLGVAAVLAQLVWFVAQEVGVFESMFFARRILVMVALLSSFVLAAMQWRATRRDPLGRAALRWFLLSWLVGSGVFGLLILMPQLFGIDTSAMQGYAFLLFVLVYVGLAFGILRFGFFGLDEWWARIVTWLGTLLLLVVFDLLFLLGLHLSSGTSMSLSLLICGLLWLPLRGFFSGRLFGRSAVNRQGDFKAVVDVALTPRPEEREVLWRQCLRGSFDPLHIDASTYAGGVPMLDDGGLALVLPSVGDFGAVRLAYARGGRSLFTSRDLETARELVGMLNHVINSRHAYEQGVIVERSRIARDIHDNLGAQLLSALHSREEGRREEVLRGALADLRGIINDASNPELSVVEALGDLRFETAERLTAGGISLDWQVADEPGRMGVSAKILNVLRPLIRETVSNILKHSGAKNVGVRLCRDDRELTVTIEDDGTGFDPLSVKPGNGLANMRERVEQVGGQCFWSSGENACGVRVTLSFPLNATTEEE